MPNLPKTRKNKSDCKCCKEILDVLKDFNSICKKCKGTGLTAGDSSNIGKGICTCCDGKGYHTLKEILEGKGCS